MSVDNLGLQSVGLMRRQTDEEFETIISKCNSMEQLRLAAKNKPELKEKLADSTEPVNIMLSDITTCLKWNEVPLAVQSSATEQEITELWEVIKEIDPTLEFDKSIENIPWKNIQNQWSLLPIVGK